MPTKPTVTKVPFGQNDKVLAAIKKSRASFVIFPDCFVERVIIQSLEATYTKAYGPDLTVGWIEDNILSPGLFGSTGPCVVLESDKINVKVKKFLIEADLSNTLPEDTKLLLFSNKKIADKELAKSLDSIQYEAPRFWEMNKYVDVLADFFEIKLIPQVRNYLVNSLEPTAESYYNALMILSAHKSDGIISFETVKGLIRAQHLDNFAQADLFNTKNMKRFFLSLLVIENDYEVYRSFFSFIQGHILKMLDPGYASAKKKPSKYDLSLENAARRWRPEELLSYMELFTELEILSKQKSDWLRDEIRKNYLKY